MSDMTDEQIQGMVKVAYGPVPEDGVLLTGEQMQRFARKAIENLLRPLEVLKWQDTP